MSRRGVADYCGQPESTVRSWINRGMANPSEEPYASFSRSYRKAERGLEAAASGSVAMIAQMLFELCAKAIQGDPDAREALIDNPQLRELLHVLQARYPKDWGASSHREPEQLYSGEEWLENNALQQEQLGALFADPPENIRAALVSRAADVYAILVAGGFEPAKKA